MLMMLMIWGIGLALKALRGASGWLTSVVLAIIVDHKHHLPFKEVVIVGETTRDAWEIFACFDVLELTLQKRGSG